MPKVVAHNCLARCDFDNLPVSDAKHSTANRDVVLDLPLAACLADYRASAQTRCIFHRNATNRALVEMLLHFDHKSSITIRVYDERIVNRRQSFGWKLYVNDRTANSRNGASRF